MDSRLRLLIFSLLLALSPAAGARVAETLTYTYYEAGISQGQSVLTALNAASPHRTNGRIFYGQLTYDIGVKYRLHHEPDGLSCKLAKLEIALSANIDLPRLVGADAPQAAAFEKFLAGLRVHELGHYAIAREVAAEVEATLAALRIPGCKALQAAVDAVRAGTARTIEERNASYDAETRHGVTQGASLQE